MILLNDYYLQPTIFPDKTSQVWKIPTEILNDLRQVTWKFESEAEVAHMIQLGELLEVEGVLQDADTPVLWIPFLPYGRQDKRTDNELAFAGNAILHAVTIGWERCLHIKTFDPHNADMALFYGIRQVSPKDIFNTIAADYETVVFPDEGAAKRYSQLFPARMRRLIGSKVRDQSTGHITHYSLEALTDFPAKGGHVLVVDDICDGGATFMVLAKSLQEQGLTADLYVSHGLFSKGVQPLLDLYGKIITTDSLTIKDKRLTVYESAAPHRRLQG